MGILDKVNNSEEQSSDSREEVTINPVQEESRGEEKDESRLKKEAEKELTGSSEVSLEDVHRQNERIIELLEQVTDEPVEEDEGDQRGGLDGVL